MFCVVGNYRKLKAGLVSEWNIVGKIFFEDTGMEGCGSTLQRRFYIIDFLYPNINACI